MCCPGIPLKEPADTIGLACVCVCECEIDAEIACPAAACLPRPVVIQFLPSARPPSFLSSLLSSPARLLFPLVKVLEERERERERDFFSSSEEVS